MANNTETVRQLLDAKTLELTKTNQHWLSFLQTAAKNFKYSLSDNKNKQSHGISNYQPVPFFMIQLTLCKQGFKKQ